MNPKEIPQNWQGHDLPELTPEDLVKLRESQSRQRLEHWAKTSAQDLASIIDKTLFDHTL